MADGDQKKSLQSTSEEQASNGMSFDAFYQICASRKSVRNFSDQKIPEAMLQNILDMAHTSPFASGRKKNWDILVVHDVETIEKMVHITQTKVKEIGNYIKDDFYNGFANYAVNFSAFASAPLVLIPLVRPAPNLSAMVDPLKDGENPHGSIQEQMRQYENDNNMKSISCVAMMILLGAHAQGLGACFMTGPCLAQKELTELLELKFGKQVGAIIPVGFVK